ncbi:MAG: hypothetical protein GY869_28380 [Planctomycetes bacterium]|nr:hypothetical protein [Planctomycetota bacterium]
MNRNETSRFWIWVCVLGLMVCLGIGQLQSQSPGDAIEQYEDLDIAYVDIRYGFSVSPPAGSEVWGGAAVGKNTFAKYLGLSDWEVLLAAESKPLVQFRQSGDDHVLTAAFLVGKENSDLKDMMQGRADYWKGKETVEKITQRENEDDGDATSWLKVELKKEAGEAQVSSIREALFAQKAGRYFLLSLISNNQPGDDALMDLIVGQFEVMSETDRKNRWTAALGQAESLMGSLDFHGLRLLMVDEQWFRIMRGKQDLGYMQMLGQLGGDGYLIPVSQATPNTLEIYELELTVDAQSYIDDKIAAEKLARLLNVSSNKHEHQGPTRESGGVKARMSKKDMIRVNFYSTVLQDMETEYFYFEVKGKDDYLYRESGEWIGGTMKVVRYDNPKERRESTVVTLELNPALYLPGEFSHLMPQILSGEPGQEYVFSLYSNRGLNDYIVRTYGRRDVEIEIEPAAAGGGEPKRKKFFAYYLVSQAGADGPIVETWVDQDGYILKQQSESIVLMRSDSATVKKMWK